MKTMTTSLEAERQKNKMKKIQISSTSKKPMKTRIVYSVISKFSGEKPIENIFMASEFYLIKAILNDGCEIISLTKNEIPITQFNSLFGIHLKI